MGHVTVSLRADPDGSVRIDATAGVASWSQLVTATVVAGLREQMAGALPEFDDGRRPFADPVALAELGARLRDTFFPAFYGELLSELTQGDGRLLLVSSIAECLNLPWELLPGLDAGFLVADGRVAIRRSTSQPMPAPSGGLVAPPLRILFSASAPLDQPALDYEKEEEIILRIADRLGGKVHLDIAESGTFDELRGLVSNLKPHVVHLSGHGVMPDGVGHFAFEDERGRQDARDGREIAERLFAGRGVRLVFVSGCQSARAGAAGLCQRLTVAGHVPLALGWGANIADDRATDFARSLYHDLASGQPMDRAVAAARRELLEKGRIRINGAERLDASFALPQLYASEAADELVDEHRPPVRPERPGIRYELLGDNIRGLREGFVGRRRVLQRTRPALQTGENTALLLTGIGGAGKSTLATRLANRCKQDGWRVVAVQARREEGPQFFLRLTGELAIACQRLGREADERLLRDGERPMAERLRLAVEILNEAQILLVLDNLEALMPRPPAPPRWEDPDFAAFFRDLTSRLTGQGRAILTCRYLPEGFDSEQPNLAHEHLPDFTEADFFKYLRRHDRVSTRIDRGELPWDLLTLFHRKLGATPRFVEQASAVLATTDPDRLREQLEGVAETSEGTETDELRELQQRYFSNLFLPQLYEALPPPHRLALSRQALLDVPIPLDGVAHVAGLSAADVRDAASQWLGLGLVQRFGEPGEVPLFGVYPLQREFLTDPARLPEAPARAAHGAAAAFFQESFEKAREEDPRLPLAVQLWACMQHANAAGDTERRRWAAILLSRLMQRHAEFQAALELLEPLLRDKRHHALLAETAHAFQSLGEWKEARRRYAEALAMCQTIGDRAGEAAAWHQLATIDLREGNYAAAREQFGKALAMRQAIGDRGGEAATWNNLASIDLNEGNYAAAREQFGKALAVHQAIGDRAGEGTTRHNLATIDLREGNYAAAREQFGKALAIRQSIGDRAGEAFTWHGLASIEMNEGNYAAVREQFGKALAMRQAIGDRGGEAANWHQLATIDLHEGNYAAAQEQFGKALAINQAIGDRAGEAATWHGLASIEMNEGNYAAAREQFGKSLALNQAIGNRAGEAATGHNLATIDVREGNFAAARERFGKSLAMIQGIGDRLGEAATFYQIGFMAWKRQKRDVGVRLVAICFGIQSAIGSGGVEETRQGLGGMATKLGLDDARLRAILQEAAEHYQRDRGAALVRLAFEGL